MDTDNKQFLDKEKLIICVDDFGLTPTINKAVCELSEAGKINATSVLVDGRFLDYEYIEKAVMLKNDGKLLLGLHLNFTELLGPAQDEDLIAPINKQIFKSQFISKTKAIAIGEEIRRQFQKFEELFDSYPDFIDGHQHIHMLPGFFDALKVFYHENRLDHNKIWLRSLNRVHLLNRTILPGASKFKNYVLRTVTKKSPSRIFSLRKELLGVYNFDVKEEDYKSLLDFWIAQAIKYNQKTGRGAVIMCHPSLPEESLPEYLEDEDYYKDPIKDARVIEYEVLKNYSYSPK